MMIARIFQYYLLFFGILLNSDQISLQVPAWGKNTVIGAIITLEQALVDDLFVASSSTCLTGKNGGQTRHSFNFTWSNLTSGWYGPNSKFEKVIRILVLYYYRNFKK